jgi:hypothetical protein
MATPTGIEPVFLVEWFIVVEHGKNAWQSACIGL